jgi:hypothetical protein
MTLTQYQIYGERSSGTNILEDSLVKNFDAITAFNGISDVTDEKFKKYGHKHWFGNHLDLSGTDDTLFICIVRDPINWLKSVYRIPRCLDRSMVKSQDTFLTSEVVSLWYVYSKIPPPDSHMLTYEFNPYTGKRYKNIFDLRHEKIKWMYEDLPKLVKNYIFIRYEDLMDDFQGTMKKIENMGLKKRDDITKHIEEMKKWMKRDGYENVEESTFEFAQRDPKEKLQPYFNNPNYNLLDFDIKDYPKEYIHYEKLLGYYKD